MRNFGFDISSLFGGFGSSSSGGFSFSDYASIKNGSYRKLLKSYYAQQKEDTSSKKTSTSYKSTPTSSIAASKILADKTGMTQVKKDADSLKSAAEALNDSKLWEMQDDLTYDMDKITDKVKSFATEYNDLLDQTGKASSADVTRSAGYMQSLTKTMSKALEKVGISIGNDGKLSVNEDTLKKANIKDLKALFKGNSSYGMQTASKAADIAKEAMSNSSLYTSSGSYGSSLSNLFNKWS